MRLVPDPNARRVALGSSTPVEPIVLSKRVELRVPGLLLLGRVHDTPGLGAGSRRPMQLEVAQEPAEEEGLARAEGPNDGNYRHLPARRDLGQDVVECVLVKCEGVLIVFGTDRYDLDSMGFGGVCRQFLASNFSVAVLDRSLEIPQKFPGLNLLRLRVVGGDGRDTSL